MNFNQATILIVAAIFFLMTISSPPYQYEDHHNSAERSAGHHLFTKPAEVKSDAEMRQIFLIPESEPPHYFTARKDKLRLFCEWLAILFSVVGGLFLAANRRTSIKLILGVFFITVGLCFSAIVCFMGRA